MPRLPTSLLALALLAASATARAQPASAPAPGPAPGPANPEAVRLAERYLRDAQAQKILDGEGPVVARYMISKIPEPAGGPQKADEVRTAMLNAADAAVNDALPEFLRRAAEIYARVFSVQELREIVAFYDSPAGKAFVSKTGDASAPIAELIRTLGDQIQVDTHRRFCAQEPESCKSSASTPSQPQH